MNCIAFANLFKFLSLGSLIKKRGKLASGQLPKFLQEVGLEEKVQQEL
jgi:hypothetical protein